MFSGKLCEGPGICPALFLGSTKSLLKLDKTFTSLEDAYIDCVTADNGVRNKHKVVVQRQAQEGEFG